MWLREFNISQYPEDDRTVFFITPPEVYPDLFCRRFPSIVVKSRHKEWRATKNGKASFLSFEPDVLSEEDFDAVTEWKDRFSQYVLLGLNQHIESVFSTELDFCLALDYTFIAGHPGIHTLYGGAIYQLKHQNNIHALDTLSGGLSKALMELNQMFEPQSPVISIVPSPATPCSVPRKLARAVSRQTGFEFVDCSLHCDKQNLKNLPISDKAREWNHIYARPDCVKRSADSKGKTVFLIDDLYQSGTTLWSCAKYLKRAGAACVIGLVCVKNFRDTDNR